jgi:hypothetical protein
MPSEPISETPSAKYVALAKENWQAFFDAFTQVLEGRRVEIEVVGLEIGDQIEAAWWPLNGLTYDRKSDTFYVYVERGDRDIGHAISQPRDILVRTGAGGVEDVVISDNGGHVHIVRLREPIMLQPGRAL